MEEVIIVDQNNQPTGSAPRSQMRQENLIHRASYILVFNNKGELFVQKRTMTKDIYPGYYDIAAGGVVQAHESYEESALRELEEELGVTAPLTHRFDHFYRDDCNQVWGRIFSCQHEGPFSLQKKEVESGQFMRIDLVLKKFAALCTPDGIEIINLIL